MNLDRRLDRAERILILVVKAGDRERREWRKQSREQTEKINMVIDAHIQGSDRLDKMAAAANEWIREQRIAYVLRNEQMDKIAARANGWVQQQRIAQVRTDKQMEGLQASQAKLEQVMAELAEEHKATERSLKAFLDGLQKGHNGKS